MTRTALPADVLHLMQHRRELLGLSDDDEDTLAAHRRRARSAVQDRRWAEDRERHYWARYRRQGDVRDATNVGARIARERERLHMSVDDLAEVTGMYPVEVEMIEAGEATVIRDQLIDIAEALFTSVAVLTGEEPARV
ncbi:helix-turn-helix domain-containing protein [Tsukamurella pseudospumae]|uniref:HTH cro/C1-type domain-containing protein n=1 Tax=Tsukamurella pseudospumae TaxID=239498 RepID=A0A138AW84_9ACTN|nr:helix-turn-helix transcriptional regulator [Tsukamurella pseudospumae]KXP14694.1 hypothetical protein AXK60_02050 [Tsukamurella pseudospumae]